MEALYLADKELTYRREHPAPEPAEGEALVRVLLAGICSTDLELVRGYYPFEGIIGHEFVGVVEVCEEADWIGRRVVGTINLSPECQGKCGRRCPEHCPDRKVLGISEKDGAFAEFVTLPISNLLAVPDDVSDEQAVFTEPLAAAVRITEQVNVSGLETAVIGPGRLGLLVAQVLRQFGAEVTVIGRSGLSLELPKDLGFATKFNDSPSLPMFDLVVEATANADGLRLAVDLIRPMGTIILKSTYAETADSNPFANFASVLSTIVVNEIKLIGSRCGPFEAALELLKQNVIQVAPLIEATYPLSDGVEAFDHAAQPGVRKVLLKTSGGSVFQAQAA